MKFDLQNFISLATYLAGVGSAVWGMLQFYSSSERKKFAAQREFEHLKRNQEQMRESIVLMTKELDELSDDMKSQSACFNLLLSQSGQTMSGIFGYKKRHENDQS